MLKNDPGLLLLSLSECHSPRVYSCLQWRFSSVWLHYLSCSQEILSFFSLGWNRLIIQEPVIRCAAFRDPPFSALSDDSNAYVENLFSEVTQFYFWLTSFPPLASLLEHLTVLTVVHNFERMSPKMISLFTRSRSSPSLTTGLP